jgi:two-component system cell cycle response regulator
MNTPKEKPIKILLIEDNPWQGRLIREMLADVRYGSKADTGTAYHLEHVGRLSTGLDRLTKGGIDVVLLDLTLPDSTGFETFSRTYSQATDTPIVILTDLDDEALATRAVREGAQDYIFKGDVNGDLLARSIRYAIERHGMQVALRDMAIKDELTGLHNRRGFLALTQQQFKIANRTKRGMFLVFADLDNMKWINDTFGHHEGDRALVEFADILNRTFRKADIIARIGGDEFAVLALEAHERSSRILDTRLQERIDARNAEKDHPYMISISKGIVRYDPEKPCSIEEILKRADHLMYRQKRGKIKEQPSRK